MNKKTPELVTQAKLLRCRGVSYRKIGKLLGRNHAAIRRWLIPLAAKRAIEVNRIWAEANREKLNEYRRARYANNSEGYREQKRLWRQLNQERDKENQRAWHEANPNYRAEYQNKKRNTDIGFKLAHNLRSRLNSAVKNGQKRGSAVDDLGCSVDDLARRFEFLFQSGMDWDNYGAVWEIDHIVPLSKINLEDPETQKCACHYSNLQPLFVFDNRSKRAKVT